MDSRSKPQLGLFCSESQLDLLARLLARRTFELPGADLPSKTLLEGEGAPRGPRLNLLGPQAQQQQIRHEGNCHRALDSSRILGHLRLAQAHHSLQFFATEFHRPSS